MAGSPEPKSKKNSKPQAIPETCPSGEEPPEAPSGEKPGEEPPEAKPGADNAP